MSQNRKIEVDGIGTVTVYKRRKQQNLKLTVGHAGQVKVSIPFWAPYRVGIKFVHQRRTWLQEHMKTIRPLTDGARIGKLHTIKIVTSSGKTIKTRVTDNTINVNVPEGVPSDSSAVQELIRGAAVRALKKEAKKLLLNRLELLAKRHDFSYRGVQIKDLRSRWGSCSEQKNIVLNCYLMQLPWELVDYVLLHELMHTRILAHGKPFWNELANYVPNLKDIRKTMRAVQPSLYSL